MPISDDPRWEAITVRFEKRREPIAGVKDFGLPSWDIDLQASKKKTVAPVAKFTFSSFGPRSSETNKKLDLLAQELSGEPELLLLHAYLISHARKRHRPELAKRLFLRLWREESDYLLENLSPRWLLSSIISFSVYGENEQQRTAGFVFNSFFSLMKLYEFERQYSGKKSDTLFCITNKISAPLPVGLTSYSMKRGDLDINTLALLYEISRGDLLVSLPCLGLLKRLLDDDGTVFSRLNAMKISNYGKLPEYTA